MQSVILRNALYWEKLLPKNDVCRFSNIRFQKSPATFTEKKNIFLQLSCNFSRNFLRLTRTKCTFYIIGSFSFHLRFSPSTFTHFPSSPTSIMSKDRRLSEDMSHPTFVPIPNSTTKVVHYFCNSLLFGLPDKSVHKLQILQISAVLLMCTTAFTDHITPFVKEKKKKNKQKTLALKVVTIMAPHLPHRCAIGFKDIVKLLHLHKTFLTF